MKEHKTVFDGKIDDDDDGMRGGKIGERRRMRESWILKRIVGWRWRRVS